jgi:predicted transcriptional regulator YdeE
MEKQQEMTKKVQEEFVEMSTPYFELMKNEMGKILAFFKGSKLAFEDAVETGKIVYGKNGGYKKEDKFIVIDKDHPFGMALYSSSDDAVINALKQQAQELQESNHTDADIFDTLGIEEENREKSKHLIAQFKELSKKFPKASIWLKGDVGTYIKGKVAGETADLSAVQDELMKEKVARTYSEKMKKVFEARDRFKQKHADLSGKLSEVRKAKSSMPQLPKEVTIPANILTDGEDMDFVEMYLDDAISDYLSDTFGFLHFGFNYEIVGDKVHVTDISWDTSESLKEGTLTEGTSNFGSNNIINLCSPFQDPRDFDDYRAELKEETPEITEEEIEEAVRDLIDMYYTDAYEQVVAELKDVNKFAEVEAGYYEGFFIKFSFRNGEELAEEFFSSDKEYTIRDFTQTVKDIEQALKNSIQEGWLVGYDVAYRFSNGETGYTLSKAQEEDLKELEVAMKKVLEDGLKAIEKEYIDEMND